MKKISVLLLAIALSCSIVACTSTQAESTPPPETQESVKQAIEAFGVVIATEIKNVTLDFQAPVEQIHVMEGERVKSGQSLVSLELLEMESIITQKELSLNASMSNMERLLEDNDLSKLQNDLKAAKDIYSKSLEELKTKEQLFESGGISQSDLDSFKKNIDNDKKAVQDITYAINSLKNSKGLQNEQQNLETSILESDLKLLKSKLDKPYLSNSDVICNMNKGIVYEIGYADGDVAGPQKKLLSIMNADTLEVEADIPEEFIKDIKIGSTVTVAPIADKTRLYTGKVSYIPGRAVNQNGETQVKIRIKLDEVDDFLLPGFNVDVLISISD